MISSESWHTRLTRDKSNTLLLIGAALLVLLPQMGHLPLWVSLVCAATLLWRTVLTLRGKRLPPSIILLPAACLAMVGILREFHTILGRDAGVAMLAMLVAFKMLEMHAKRDLFVVVFLCFFIMLTNFLYSQSIGTGAMMLLSLVVLVTAQLTFQFTGRVPPLRRRLLLGATIVGCAVPLAVVLFVVFPRVTGPLWGMPGDAGAGRTGLSDQMAPGNMASLAQNDDPAFRVRFLDPVPAQEQLYWRAVVLSNFDGRTWTRGRRTRLNRATVTLHGPPIRHQITLEAASARWLFALDLPARMPQLPGHQIGVTREFEIATDHPLAQRVRYDAVSYPRYELEAEPELDDVFRWVQLPVNTNPRARAWGEELAQIADPQQRINTVLQRFRREPYVYTLEPPLLPGRDTIDDFLFGSRAGFCEHYAGAFVFLMRASGLPARVVTGYQGGELNPVDGYLTVRQSDAHAWAEVWVRNRGWIRVDPTAAVAPERVRRGLASAITPPAPFGIPGLQTLVELRNTSPLLASLRFHLAAINNGWNQWVLNYTPERQRGVMDTLTLMFGNLRTLLAIVSIAILVAIARKVRQRTRGDPIDVLYSALCRQLANRGLVRAPDEGPTALAARVRATPLEGRDAVLRFLALYSDYKYAAQAAAPDLPATLKKLLNESR